MTARSVFRYEEALERTIAILKSAEMEPAADCFAERLALRMSGGAAFARSDAVVRLPLNKTRQAGTRG